MPFSRGEIRVFGDASAGLPRSWLMHRAVSHEQQPTTYPEEGAIEPTQLEQDQLQIAQSGQSSDQVNPAGK